MPSSWTTSAGEVLLDLDAPTSRPGRQLRLALRGAIADGVLQPGTRLPSSRSLAGDLGVSRGVVVEVYEQLAAEGWLVARQGSGTVVADHPSQRGVAPDPVVLRRPAAALDLRPARPDVASFPRSAWVAATRAVLADLSNHDLSYGDHRGHRRAREVYTAYLVRVRGLRATSEAMVVSNGFSGAIGSVVAMLVQMGCGRIAVEDPGGYEPRRRVVAAGGEPAPIPVDGDGMRVDLLESSGVDAVMVTPAHQYPMGGVLAADRRAALADWARQGNRWIIEDDYDAEFRYDREPVGAVQGLVPERTIYMGSVAKTLAPSVRVGWTVVPEELLAPLVDAHETRMSQPATLEQLVLADLIDNGRYDRHLRNVRRRYRERRDALLQALAEVGLGDAVAGVAAGMQAVVLLDDVDDQDLADDLHDRGVEVVALSRYAVTSKARGLVVGFGQPSPDELRRGVRVIGDAARRARGRP